MLRALLIVSFFLISTSCKDNISVEQRFILYGVIYSDYDGSVVPNAEIYFNGYIADTTSINGEFRIPQVKNGVYSITVKNKDHRTITIDSVLIADSDNFLNITLDFKYNLISEIQSSFRVENPENLIGSYQQSSEFIRMNDDAFIDFKFTDPVIQTDTVEFSFSHTSRDALFFQHLRISFNGTNTDEIISITNNNNGNITTVRFFPESLNGDSTHSVRLSVESDNQSPVENLKLQYFTSF